MRRGNTCPHVSSQRLPTQGALDKEHAHKSPALVRGCALFLGSAVDSLVEEDYAADDEDDEGDGQSTNAC